MRWLQSGQTEVPAGAASWWLLIVMLVLVLLQIEAVRCALAAIWPDGGVGWRRLLVAFDPDVAGSLPTAVAVRT